MNKPALFFGLGVVFVLLAVIVPVSIWASSPYVISGGDAISACGQIEGFVFDEHGHGKRAVEYGKEGDKYLRVYETNKFELLEVGSKKRVYNSPIVSVKLNRDIHVVGFSVGPTTISVTMNCTSEDIQVYILNLTEYKTAVGRRGKIDTSKISERSRKMRDKCLAPGEIFSASSSYYDKYGYLVIANPNNKDVTVNFQYSLSYDVYQTILLPWLNMTSRKLTFYTYDLAYEDVILIDYPCEGNEDYPESIEARIYAFHPYKVAVGVTAGVFGVLAIIMIVIGFIYLIKKEKSREERTSLTINYQKQPSTCQEQQEQPDKAVITL